MLLRLHKPLLKKPSKELFMENTAKPKRKLYTAEIVLYSVFGAIWVLGFVFAILGVCAYNVGKLSLNPLYQMQKDFATFFHMEAGVIDFRLWGSLVMIVAMIAFLIAIFAFTNKSNQEEAARRRKEERMKILMDLDLSTKQATEALKAQENTKAAE